MQGPTGDKGPTGEPATVTQATGADSTPSVPMLPAIAELQYPETGTHVDKPDVEYIMKPGRTSHLPAPIKTSGIYTLKDHSPSELLNLVETVYSHYPLEGLSSARRKAATKEGIVSEKLREMKDGEPLSPTLELAVLSMLEAKAGKVERPLVEAAAWGQGHTGFPFNREPIVKLNQDLSGYPCYATDPDLRKELAQDVVDGFFETGVWKEGDRALDNGAGYGDFADAASRAGIEVTATEVQPREEHRTTFPGMTYEMIEYHAGKRPGYYDVIIANHFSALTPDGEGSYFRAARKALKPETGIFALGVSTISPDRLSGETGTNLRPELEKDFDVEFWSAKKHFPKQFAKNGSIAGMMGFFICRPKQAIKVQPAVTTSESSALTK